jgi:lipopolysaccharide exporter
MTTLGRQMAKGAVWMIAARFADRGIGIVSTVVLARLLVPADFGLVSMAVSIIAMLEVLGSFNFDVALIQNHDAERRHYDTAWTFNVCVGLASGLALLGVAHPASQFFREPRLQTIVLLFAGLPLLEGLHNIGLVEFRKHLQFDREFAYLFARRIVTFLIVLPLALVYRNYWALVTGVLTGKIVSLCLSYVIQRYRPRFSLAARHELFHFSKWLYLGNLTQFLIHRAPDLVIGRIAGTSALGLFNVAHEIAYLPTNELVAPINRAIFPGYAKKSKDIAVLREGFVDVISVIGLLMIPAAAGMFITSDLLVAIFLGDKWLAAQPIIRLLAIAGMIFALQTNPTYVHYAMGNPRTVSWLTFLYALSLLPIMVVATSLGGPLAAAWAYIITASLVLPITYSTLIHRLELRWSALAARLWRPLLATAAMWVVLGELVAHLDMPHESLARAAELLLIVLGGALVYTAALFGLWRLSGMPAGAERMIFDLVRQKLARNGRLPGLSG